MPGAKPLKCLQKVVGEGNRPVGGVGVCVFARFGEEDHSTLLPEAWCIPEEEAGPVNDSQDMKYIRGKVQEDRLEAVGTRGLLRVEVRHGILDGVGSHNIVEMFHDSGGRGRCMLIDWHMACLLYTSPSPRD